MARRVTYWIGSQRVIIILTAFRKQRQQERRELARAHRALMDDRDGRVG